MQGGTGTFTFTGTPNGTISANNGTITQSVAPGTYTATETAQAGWTLTSIVCDDGGLTPSSGVVGTGVTTFNVSAGENVTCTYTNTKTSSITIKKVMVGGTGTFTFTGTPSGRINADNGTRAQIGAARTFNRNETAQAGW